jgi:glucose/arabinose dehydrogenase
MPRRIAGGVFGLLLAVVAAVPASAAEEVALFDPSTGKWHLRWDNGRVDDFFYGIPGDTPLLGDWDCDGVDTVAMYRESSGFIYLRNTNDFGVGTTEFYYGQVGDRPIAGDWDGDGCDTLAIYRGGKVFISNELGTRPADQEFFFGVPGDRPFSGDFNGDGRDSIGLYRRSNGFVYMSYSIPEGSLASTDNEFFYGVRSDRIVAGDWDGDGVDTVGIFRPGDARFYLSNRNQTGLADLDFPFGKPGWLPAAGELGVPRGIPAIALETVADGLSFPTFAAAPAGDDRLFVAEKSGVIRIIENGSVVAEPFLDISALVRDRGEQGLLGLAFHPDYGPARPSFYVHYSDANGDTVVAEYARPSDFGLTGPDRVKVLFQLDQPFGNHNGGMIQFGPDRRLYLALGDGGGGGDPLDHGQNPSTALGSIVAIDADSGASQIWAIGLRNPWRFDFDDGLIYIADVGQSDWEEVSVGSSTVAGQNFGWNIQEGFACYSPSSGCNTGGLVQPALAYPNPAEGCSVTGGFVYRGSAIAHLSGTYLYSDYCSGFLRGLFYNDGTIVAERDWTIELPSPGRVVSFGEDGFGELYVLTAAGEVLKVVAG